MQTLALGLFAAVVSMATLYFAQFFYTTSGKSLRMVWEHPYTQATPLSDRYKRLGIGAYAATIMLAVASSDFSAIR
jgi:hypothetical protein